MKQIILFLLVLLPVCAFAQFTETFDGPEVDSKNPWKGDLDKFVIDPDGWLQLAAPKDQKKAEISVPLSYSNNMEWLFDVRLLFEPTNQNCAKIYIYTDKHDIMDFDDDYYIQVGSNDRDITLRRLRETEKSPKKLIVGQAGLLKKADNLLHIKLTLENNKEWKLYVKTEGQAAYSLQGDCTAAVSPLNKGGSFRIQCVYSKSRSDLFYFDNIKATSDITNVPEDPDPVDPPAEVILPTLLDITPLSLSELLFTFDKPVDKSNAQFSITEIGNATSISYGNAETIIKVSFPKDMIAGESYTISYSGLADLDGNKMDAYSQEFTLEGEEDKDDEEDEITPGSILINEIMADPKGLEDLPQTEYVELYNPTDNNITLSDWQFSYGGKAKPMATFELPANGYAVLYHSGRDIDVDPSAVQVPLDKFPSSLANAGKQIMLLDASGTIIDEYTYPKAKPAQSWERSSSGSWHLSSDPRGGTPGSANSSGEKEDDKDPDKPNDPEKPDDPDKPDDPVIPDDTDKPTEPTIPVEPLELVINELLPNPFVGGSEYIELYNRSDHALHLSGLVVATRKTDGTLSTRYPLSSVGTMIEPGGYAVLTKSKAGVADFYTIQSPASLFEIAKLPILANTSSTLVLFRASDGTVIDEVAYSSKWHASSVKNQKGVALERIDPEAETQRPANWTSAAASAGYGTPGYRNSQSDNPSPDEPDAPTGIEAPEWLPGSDNYKISYYLDQPGYNCRAFVYNTAGQRVARIANHELLGLSGQLTWDGSSLSGNRLRTGVYIFYAEIYHTNGQIKTYKKVFLVR